MPAHARQGSAAEGILWFGQLVALMDTAASHHIQAEDGAYQWAFVRCLENAPETRASWLAAGHDAPALVRPSAARSMCTTRSQRAVLISCNLVQLAAIKGASKGHFYYKHYVW